MAKSKYSVITRTRNAKPRSKRLAGMPVTGTGDGGSVIVSVSGNGAEHTHENKALLDALAQDLLGYLYLRFKAEGADESTLQKIKAGFADNAAEADVAKNAEKWGGNQLTR